MVSDWRFEKGMMSSFAMKQRPLATIPKRIKGVAIRLRLIPLAFMAVISLFLERIPRPRRVAINMPRGKICNPMPGIWYR
jgi:hypothetical protein